MGASRFGMVSEVVGAGGGGTDWVVVEGRVFDPRWRKRERKEGITKRGRDECKVSKPVTRH